MKEYIFKFSCLSLAPQVLPLELKCSGKLLKRKNDIIKEEDFIKCVKSVFPVMSLVSVQSITCSEDRFRQNISMSVKSLREPTNTFIVEGLNQDLFSLLMKELNVK